MYMVIPQMNKNPAEANVATSISSTNDWGIVAIDAAPAGVDDAEAAPESVPVALIVSVGVDDGVTPVADEESADEESSDVVTCESSRSEASK
jgi:hypothetical protein